jgi:RNA polymerase sigma-70 factor (ECF subfamily)
MGEDVKREDEMSAGAAAISAPRGEIERLFESHHGLVYRAAYRITGNRGDAEDVLQTVFLRLLRQGWRSEPIERVESYLRRAAVNAALDVVRGRTTRRDAPLEDAAWAEDTTPRPDRSFHSSELRDCLRKAVAELPPRAAEMFALRYFEEFDNREIARLVGTTASEVAVVLYRSRQRLQEEIRSQFGDSHE